jgi:hypothetical protein
MIQHEKKYFDREHIPAWEQKESKRQAGLWEEIQDIIATLALLCL